MAEKANITLKIDRQLLRGAKIIAAREETSISALLSELLAERVRKDRDYARAKRRALARMRKGFDLGFTPPQSRDELHER